MFESAYFSPFLIISISLLRCELFALIGIRFRRASETKTDSMPEITVQLHNLLGGIQIIKPEAGHIYNARVLQFATLRFGIPCASSVLDGTQSTTQSPSMLPPILWPIASKIEKGIDAADCPVP
jgi:hypothetical protein